MFFKSYLKPCSKFLLFSACVFLFSCKNVSQKNTLLNNHVTEIPFPAPDTLQLPKDEFGTMVKYGRELMLNTAKYIGPDGINGKYLGNRMNCTNCHQDAGTKAFSLNLMLSHDNYPQYRARENRVLTLAERVNNCIERPHNGKPLPLDSKEMIAFLSYLKWISSYVKPEHKDIPGFKNKKIVFPDSASSSLRGAQLYVTNCQRCHGEDGQGQMSADKAGYVYPPLWGKLAYQQGSSMHRNIKLSEWLKMNMPYDKTQKGKGFLTDNEALDIAAFINNDTIHQRPNPLSFDYPNTSTKPIDYDLGPYVDRFTAIQHKYGPYPPIIEAAERQGRKVTY